MFGYAYLDFQAACMSMKPLMADAPGPERLMHRAKSVCLHEIGHTLGLHDHYDEAGRRCVMHGTVSAEELYETAAYSSDFCPPCLGAIKDALKAIDAAAYDGLVVLPTPGGAENPGHRLLSQSGPAGTSSGDDFLGVEFDKFASIRLFDTHSDFGTQGHEFSPLFFG